MISTVIFDMDGVIINSEPIHQQIESDMFAGLGLNISDEEHKSFVGTSGMDMWLQIGTRHHLAKTPEELLIEGRNKYWVALDSGKVALVEGVMDLIGFFHQKQLTLQVASSATRPTVDKVLEYFGLENYFIHRIGGNEVSRSKPEPEIFLKAARQSNADPGQCLVIEDSRNGVMAAKSAGMTCIGFQNPGSGDQDLSGADMVVQNLSEIRNFL